MRADIYDLAGFENHLQAYEAFQSQIYAGMDLQNLLIYLLLFLMVHFFVGLAFPFGRLRLPFFWTFFSKMSVGLTQRLNRSKRGAETLVSRGMLFAIVMLLCAYILGDFFRQVTEMQHALMQRYAWLVIVVLWMGSLNFVLPLLLLKKNMKDLSDGALDAARQRLQPFCPANLVDADMHMVARYTVETSLLLFVQLFVAPLFWFLLAGGYGLFCYVVLAAAYRQIVQLGAEKQGYAVTVVRLYRLFDYLPQKLMYAISMMALFAAPMAQPLQAWKNRKNAGKCGLIERLYVLVSHGFDFVLGGRYRHVVGPAVERGWYGSAQASAKMEAKTLNKVMILLLLNVSFVAVMVSFLIFYMK